MNCNMAKSDNHLQGIVRLLLFGSYILYMFLCSSSCEARKNYEGYSLLRVKPETQEQVNHVHRLSMVNEEIDFWKESSRVGYDSDIMVSPGKAQEIVEYLRNGGLAVQFIYRNLRSLIEPDNQRLDELDRRSHLKGVAFDYDQYHNFEDVMNEMEDLVTRCPQGFSCETYVIGHSYEGREQKVLRIYKPGPNREIHWIDTTIHSREWLGLAVHMKMVNHVFTNYGTDEKATMFLDKGDWYFLFIHNPDGYEYTWTEERLWRKNRFNNSLVRETTCVGVDMNRNFMHRWGNAGTSDNPCTNTYRGAFPSSEVEVQNVQNEILKMKGRIRVFVSIHTAARLILNPWGSVLDPGTDEICEHFEEPKKSQMEMVSKRMAKAIEDTFGHSSWEGGSVCEVIYPASGGTLDFAVALGGAKFSFTPELRDTDGAGDNYGFAAPPAEIQPAFEETWNGFVAMMEAIDEIESEYASTSSKLKVDYLYVIGLLILFNMH